MKKKGKNMIKIYLPSREDLRRCMDTVEKAGGLDNGVIDWVINRKEYGYTVEEAFTILEIVTHLVLEVAPLAEKMNWDVDSSKKYVKPKVD